MAINFTEKQIKDGWEIVKCGEIARNKHRQNQKTVLCDMQPCRKKFSDCSIYN